MTDGRDKAGAAARAAGARFATDAFCMIHFEGRPHI